MTTQHGVIPSLMAVLMEAREDAGLDYRHLRAHTQRTERQFRRYELCESFPRGREMDEIVGLYAKLTERNPLDLWRRAIERAESEARALGQALGPGAGAESPEDVVASVDEARREARERKPPRAAEGDA